MRLIRIKLISVLYLLLGYATAFLNVILNLILIKFLSVENYGYVSLGKTVFQTFEYSHLGIRFAFDRLLPDIDRREKRLTYFKVGLLYNLVTSLMFVLFWIFYYKFNLIFYIWFIIAGYVYSNIQLIRIYYRSFDDKSTFVKVSAISFMLPIGFQLIFFYFFNYYGIGIGLFLSNLFVFILLILKLDDSVKYKDIAFFKFKYIGLLLANKGVVLFFTSMLSFFAVNGDRFFIEKYWGVEAVGQYTAILLFPSLINIFSTSFTELVVSKIIKKKSSVYTVYNILILLSIVGIAVFITYLVIPFLLNCYLLKYAGLISQIKIAVFLSLFICVVPILEYYFHSLDFRKYVLITQLISMTMYFLIMYVVLTQFSQNITLLLSVKFGYYILVIVLMSVFMFRVKYMMKKC